MVIQSNCMHPPRTMPKRQATSTKHIVCSCNMSTNKNVRLRVSGKTSTGQYIPESRNSYEFLGLQLSVYYWAHSVNAANLQFVLNWYSPEQPIFRISFSSVLGPSNDGCLYLILMHMPKSFLFNTYIIET